MIIQPILKVCQLGRAIKDPNADAVLPKVTEYPLEGSAVFVSSKPVPGAQLMFDSPGGLPFRLTEGAFLRPGGNFKRFYVRHEANDGGTFLLAVYPPMPEDDYPSLLQVQPLERSRGVVDASDTVAAATAWKARLQNNEPFGGRTVYVHSLDLEHSLGSGTSVRVRVDMNEDITTGVAGEVARLINWNGAIANVTQSKHMPAVQSKTKGDAWATPLSSYFLTLSPENGISFDPPGFPLMPQKEIRVIHLSAPGLTGTLTADISGDVLPTVS